MAHSTIIQTVDGDGRVFIIIIVIVVVFNTLRRQQTVSKKATVCNWQRATVSLVTHICQNNVKESNLFIMKLNEYQNTIYVKLQSVNLTATVTNKISHVADKLAGDFIKQY